MKDIGKVIIHIPARGGSKRVPRKNLRQMNGKPMVSYAIESAIKADVTNDIYVNTDCNDIAHYVLGEYPINVYMRSKNLATDNATSDDFNLDIIEKLCPDTLVMINPVCPLITHEDIRLALHLYRDSNCDTLISSCKTNMQCFCNGEAININVEEQLAPSQENNEVITLNWAISVWNAKKFKNRMRDTGYAVLGEHRVFYNISSIKGVKVSNEEDFLFCEKLLQLN